MVFSMCKYYFNIVDFKYMRVFKYSQGHVFCVCMNRKIIYIYIYIYIWFIKLSLVNLHGYSINPANVFRLIGETPS